MKFTLSISTLLIVHIHAARLLQQVTNSCNLNCNSGEKCYSTSTGPTCCKPYECAYGGICLKDNFQFNCPVGFECVTNPDSPQGAGICIDVLFSPIPPFELCANTQCAFGTQCYQMSTGAECCDPNICETGTCAGINNIACPIGYECVKGCPTCSGVCVSPNIRANIGDTCNTCIQPLCACGLCPDGVTSFGCCGGCRYQFALDGNIICSSDPITSESNCPAAAPAPTEVQFGHGPVEGDICTGCDKCPCQLCADGQTLYGCCAGCQYHKNSIGGELICVADFSKITTVNDCPRIATVVPTVTDPVFVGKKVEGDLCTGCELCACELCPTGANGAHQYGCCDGCAYTFAGNGNLICSAVITNEGVCFVEKIEGELCGVQGIDCARSQDATMACSDGKCYGNCGSCSYQKGTQGSLICKPELIAEVDVCPCGGFLNCDNYFDGCNECFCNADGSKMCSSTICSTYTDAYCEECFIGYQFNANTKQCERSVPVIVTAQPTTPAPITAAPITAQPTTPAPITAAPVTAAPVARPITPVIVTTQPTTPAPTPHPTTLAPVTAAPVIPIVTPTPVVPVVTCPNCKVGHCVSSKCSQCDFTHHPNTVGVCVPKHSCSESRDCDRAGGFRCRNDPRCRAPVQNEPYCGVAMVNAPKICFDYDGYDFCSSDVDCNTNNGFVCFLDAHYVSGSGFCGKYQI